MTSSFNILSGDQADYVRNNSICRIAERIHSDYEYQGTEIPHKTARNNISKMFTTLEITNVKRSTSKIYKNTLQGVLATYQYQKSSK
jgi:hypothetical protein